VGLIVEPQLSFTPDLDFGHIPLQGIRHPFPLVTASFLWPFGCRPHPNNVPAQDLLFGAYPDELGDAYLIRMRATGIAVAAIVDHDLNLDVPRALNLDWLFAIWRDLQRRRDALTGYHFAGPIEARFRHEHLLFTRHHPGRTMFHAMIEQFLARMAVPRDQVDATLRRVRGSPFCLAPDDRGGHIALSRLLFTQRRLDASHVAVTTAIALAPEVAEFHALSATSSPTGA
jgi:hypothetical protein